METPEHAWHYTTAAGLINIITSNRVWATSAAYMNDRDEIRAGREAMQRAIAQHQPALAKWQLDQLSMLGVTRSEDPHDLFMLSASVVGDALTLWRSYGVGSEAEYAIDFDPSVSLLPVQHNAAESHPHPEPPNWRDGVDDYTDEGEPFQAFDPDEAVAFGGAWGKVEYLDPTNSAAQQELEEVLKALHEPPPGKRTMPFYMDYLAGPDPTVHFKHAGFSDEEEVRALWTVQPWWRFVLYRATRFGVTPYIEVATSSSLDNQDERTTRRLVRPEDIDRLPIRAVRIGPTRAAGDAEKSLRRLLDLNGYGTVEIKQSLTPYR